MFKFLLNPLLETRLCHHSKSLHTRGGLFVREVFYRFIETDRPDSFVAFFVDVHVVLLVFNEAETGCEIE